MENHEHHFRKTEFSFEEKIFRYKLLDDSLQAFESQGVDAGSLGLCSRVSGGFADLCVCFNPVSGGYWLQGKQSCHSVSSCPVCSYNISVERTNDIGSLVFCARKFGYGVYLVSLTCRHTSKNSLNDLIVRLGFACNELFRRHDTRDYLKKIGCIGRVTTYEVMMMGVNGFHPHYHILLVADENLNELQIARDLLFKWRECLDKFGLWCNEHGLDVQGYNGVGDYITKMQLEMCLLNWKKGNNDDSVSPFQCLKIYHDTKENDVAKIWVDYCKAIKGKRIQVWSRGLKNIFDLMEKILDQKKWRIKPEDKSKGVLFLEDGRDYEKLSPSAWQVVINNIACGRIEDVEQILKRFRILYYINYPVLKEIQDRLD